MPTCPITRVSDAPPEYKRLLKSSVHTPSIKSFHAEARQAISGGNVAESREKGWGDTHPPRCSAPRSAPLSLR